MYNCVYDFFFSPTHFSSGLLACVVYKMFVIMQVEQLEQEVAELQQVIADKKEQEAAMLQVLVCTCFLQCLFL